MQLAAALALLALAVPAPAQNKPPNDGAVQVSAGLVCDTPKQIVRYVELFRGNARAAADAVNAEEGKDEACVIGVVAFIRGENVTRIKSVVDEAVQIAEILVVAVATPAGMEPIEPVHWYTIFPVDEAEA